jgi:hypothetical protein
MAESNLLKETLKAPKTVLNHPKEKPLLSDAESEEACIGAGFRRMSDRLVTRMDGMDAMPN